ncbi:MAG TPA: hypothetical protein VE673_03355 [Pseudonocardiaceae bacterium]|jgi:hypothetical protein|nr:hypothetical protein [Pseudonocardiaceae bacterium]
MVSSFAGYPEYPLENPPKRPDPLQVAMTKTAGRRAAQQVSKRQDLHVTVPGLGQISLGPPDQLAYLAGIATLAALEIIEWPLACIIAAGHLLADQRRSATLHDFGEALEEA